MASRVVHFEISSADPEKAGRFYTEAFGWQIQKWDGPIEYWLIKTGEGGPGIDGGIMRKDGPFDRVINTINVDDVAAMSARVQELGGSLVGDRTPIPDVGDLQYARDPDGNLFGMLQPVMAQAATT